VRALDSLKYYGREEMASLMRERTPPQFYPCQPRVVAYLMPIIPSTGLICNFHFMLLRLEGIALGVGDGCKLFEIVHFLVQDQIEPLEAVLWILILLITISYYHNMIYSQCSYIIKPRSPMSQV